jgi:hypothetical protein
MEFYKRENDGSEALDASVLMFVTSGSTMWAAANDSFTARLQEATDMWDKALRRKVMWSFLMAPIYAHEDRKLFIDTVVGMVFSHKLTKLTMLLKIYIKDGSTQLYLVSARNMQLCAKPETNALIFKTERE